MHTCPTSPVEHLQHTWLQETAKTAEIVMGVCTGSVLLARSGLLDGRRATTNKMDFSWAMDFGPNVNWVGKARWVVDGKYVTSSGVSAGMDMSLAVIAKTLGIEKALGVAKCAEYCWHQDSSVDPFAVEHGVQ